MSSIFKKVAKKVKGAASRKPTNGSPSTTPSSTPSVTNFNTYDSEETYVDYLQREIELQGNVAEVPEEEGMEGMDLGDDQVPEDEPLIQTPISGQSSSRIPPRNKGKGKAPTIEEEEEAEEEVPQAPTNTNRTKSHVWNFFSKVPVEVTDSQTGKTSIEYQCTCALCERNNVQPVAYKWRTGNYLILTC